MNGRSQIAAVALLLTASSGVSLADLSASGSAAEKGGRWIATQVPPAVSLRGTVSKAAGAAGVKHVVDCVMFEAGAIAAPAATALTVDLRDGASGAGSVLKQWRVIAPATAGQHAAISVCGLGLTGTAATAMTLEFSALLTNEFQSVSMTGYDTN